MTPPSLFVLLLERTGIHRSGYPSFCVRKHIHHICSSIQGLLRYIHHCLSSSYPFASLVPLFLVMVRLHLLHSSWGYTSTAIARFCSDCTSHFKKKEGPLAGAYIYCYSKQECSRGNFRAT